ncbi:MAG: DNA integrity scanning protein DisA nucleotide-binding domain protein [Polyangiaceae bacterium]
MVAPKEHLRYELSGSGINDCHPLAPIFASHVHNVATAALEGASALHSVCTGSTTTERCYELLAGAAQSATISSMMRELLELPLPPLGAFMLGHRPFTGASIAAGRVLDWLHTLPAKTYEGASIVAGAVIEATPGSLEGLEGVRIHRFERAIPFEVATSSGQTLALADGKRSFLVLRENLSAIGVAATKPNLDNLARSPAREAELPFHSLWLQVQRPQLLRLFGVRNGYRTPIGTIRNGTFSLSDPASVESAITKIVSGACSRNAQSGVADLVAALLRRADDMSGAGLVIGTSRSHKGKRLKIPANIDAECSWDSFLNPDGAVLIDRNLRLHEYGVILPQPERRILANHGTRHNALAQASRERGCVAIAVSDDGILSAFRQGKLVLRAF